VLVRAIWHDITGYFQSSSFIECIRGREGVMRYFLFGLGLGFGAGVLFAPKSGREIRENIADRAGDLADSAKVAIEHGRERIRSGISAVRNAARPTGTEGANL
jgi:gas vesicle protein